ncbi:cytochrome c oxidase subunit 5A, mitochondrial [Caretta caretta]|nr:cytochrome c oxidase subunit 5A, mitochondrial [Caretta caretta]
MAARAPPPLRSAGLRPLAAPRRHVAGAVCPPGDAVAAAPPLALGPGAWWWPLSAAGERKSRAPVVPSRSPARSAMLGAALLLRRCTAAGLRGLARGARQPPGAAAAVLPARCYSHGTQESDEEFDARWVTYFNKPDIDAWELRKGMNTLVGYDLVPEPKIIDAALRACRRLNDFATAVRILEVVKDKAGPHKEIYPYVIQELRPTLNELGISTPEELGLDKA